MAALLTLPLPSDLAVSLSLFQFDDNEVRVKKIDGDHWFHATDSCLVLGIVNPTNAIRPLDDDDRLTLQGPG